jgi:phage repressor protein C with HTH and peptisase S24 domain
MDNNIVSRIKGLMEYYSLNSLSLSKMLGYNSSEKLSRLFRDKGAKPSYDIIYDISNKFEINIEWLITGRGEMLNPDDDSSPVANNSSPREDLISIPIVDVEGAAGHGAINPDYPEQTGEILLPTGMLSKRRGTYYCGLMRGDSMYPTLLDRDHIIFRLLDHGEWEYVRDGEVYFIVDRFGQAYIKRITNRLRDENRLVCTSDNKEADFPDFNIMGDNISNIYYVECRLSNNMANLNNYNNQLKALQEDMEMLKAKLKHL